MAKKPTIKQQGDQELLALVTKIQQKMNYNRTLDDLSIDQSSDNLIANKILRAKYNFLYREARERQAHSQSVASVVFR